MPAEHRGPISGGDTIYSWERGVATPDMVPPSWDDETAWAGFPRELDATTSRLPFWAIGPFTRHPCNPVLAPTPGAWDCGRFGGGVHNGSVLIVDGKFHYVYRGEQDLRPGDVPGLETGYMCDIGLATSDDGVRFQKDSEHSPFFRHGEDRKYSFEDASCVRYGDTYYLFCNRWYWPEAGDPRTSGAWLATSTDLRRWTKHGLCFPNATRTHRNPVILQTPHNEAARVNGKFVMYLNHGLIAYSEDLLHWESRDVAEPWPGGENCFALVDWSESYKDNILVFTGGAHSGHFYAVGEVLLDRAQPEQALEWLPRPILYADPQIPWENGRSARPPHNHVSQMLDCIFFNGMTLHNDQWWVYYGGSEVYTCLATAPAGAHGQ